MTHSALTEDIENPGDVAAEYAAVRKKGAGLVDLSSRGRFTVGGSEAVQFLNGLITNDMKTLTEDAWMPATFPNVQGRLLASVRVARLKPLESEQGTDPNYLIDTEAATRETVFKTLQRFTLAGDFRVEDKTSLTRMFSVQGSGATAVMRSVFGDGVERLGPNAAVSFSDLNADVTRVYDGVLICASHTGSHGFDLIVNEEASLELQQALISAGAMPVGEDVFEVLRIEAGIPRYGVDMDETNVVTETNLDDAVSYTKGCYIGQEIIARIKYRGHVAKKLAGLSFADKVEVASGDVIKSLDDKDIGRITSVTYSPQLKRTVALGYVKYDYLAAGTSVKVFHDESEVPAHVTGLPFIRDEQSDVG